jgi:CheY-like chemotaxis protein
MKPHHILVVDDNPNDPNLTSDVLEFEDYHLGSAADATAALPVIRQPALDLILMDIAPPGTDGMTSTRKVFEMPGGRISVASEFGKGSIFTVTLPQTFQKGQA